MNSHYEYCPSRRHLSSDPQFCPHFIAGIRESIPRRNVIISEQFRTVLSAHITTCSVGGVLTCDSSQPRKIMSTGAGASSGPPQLDHQSPPTPIRKGACLCRGIKYVVTGDPWLSVLCHCNNCRASSGSAFMANVFFENKVGISYLYHALVLIRV